jgi:DNA repair exonuclease SbcCD ATPase subunit
VATLEDAAEELVVKLRGLDSEIEESEHRLEELRGRMDAVAHDVEEDWTALTTAVTSFLEKVHTEQEALDTQAKETLAGVGGAQQAVAEEGAAARSEIAEGTGQLEGLAQHATGLAPAVESLAEQAGEAPAKGLAERAHALQQELERAVNEARDFLHDELVPAVEQVATDVHQRAQAVHDALAQEMAQALQHAYEEWEPKVGELEEYVESHGFETSQQHAHDVVEYALGECRTGCGHHVDEVHQLVGLLVTQLGELASEVHKSAEALVMHAGADLIHELEQARTSGQGAVTALDSVKQRLAGYSFMEA